MGKMFGGVRVISGNYAPSALDVVLLCDVTNGPCNIQLPGGVLGDAYVIKHYKGDISKNNITVIPKSGVVIDEMAQVSLYNHGQGVWLAYLVDRYTILSWI